MTYMLNFQNHHHHHSLFSKLSEISFLSAYRPYPERENSKIVDYKNGWFRPISLYNVSMKTVSKMIVNRLKEVLDTLIFLNQASFVPGRKSLDNIIICQEMIHALRYTKVVRGEWY